MDKNIYDLFAVVLHTGTLNGGHYTALAKNDKYWYEFNDH
jgi:ubiquitin C-terminal hydrolase